MKRKGKEVETIELTQDDINIHTLFEEFHSLKNFPPGEGTYFPNTASWLSEREEAHQDFRKRFRSPGLNPSNTKEVFRDFLYFRNNKSWTTLYRTGTSALETPERLLALISWLVDDAVNVNQKLNKAISGDKKVKGIGKNILTGIIHVCDENDKYGVWNGRTEHTLKLLRRMPAHARFPGETYDRINAELHQLKNELSTNLGEIDCFMWYISKRVKVIGHVVG
ncbi:MAG: hypothetical protein V3U49_07835 [Nitrososphaerales archaeon]